MRVFSWIAAGIVAISLCGCIAQSSAPQPQRLEAFKFVSGFFGLDAARERGGQASQMTVIGAGFSRTGTKSLEAALVRLGHKVYDTRSMMQLGHVAQWEEAAAEYKATGNLTMFDHLLAEMEAKGYTATLDFPMNLYAPLFAKRRPLAKVLMSVRASEESWVEAWATVNKILGHFIARPWKWIIDMHFTQRILMTLYDFDFEYSQYLEHISRPLPWFEVVHLNPTLDTETGREAWKALHRRLQRELEEQLPKERFATFDVRSGWGQLLRFLEIDDPALAAEPFPRVNDRGSLQAVRLVMDIIAAGLPLWVLLQLWVLHCSVRWCCCRRSGQPAKEKSG